jgi:hypothetical protein
MSGVLGAQLVTSIAQRTGGSAEKLLVNRGSPFVLLEMNSRTRALTGLDLAVAGNVTTKRSGLLVF